MVDESRLEEFLYNWAKDLISQISGEASISKPDLRRVLRFLSKVIELAEQAFQDVYTVLIELKYLTIEDTKSGRLTELQKELDLLESRENYRDVEQICARLALLEKQYYSEITSLAQPFMRNDIFRKMMSQETDFIKLSNESVWELQFMLWKMNKEGVDKNALKSINEIASQKAQAIKLSLMRLREVQNTLLGLSGEYGFLELTEINRNKIQQDVILLFDHSQHNITQSATEYNLQIGGLTMGDNYNVGQAGAVGPNSHAHDMKYTQVWNKNSIDLPQLAEELSQLRIEMKKRATEPDHDVSIGAIATAEQAAKAGDGTKTIEALKSAGKWAFNVATSIGTGLVVATLKSMLGL